MRPRGFRSIVYGLVVLAAIIFVAREKLSTRQQTDDWLNRAALCCMLAAVIVGLIGRALSHHRHEEKPHGRFEVLWKEPKGPASASDSNTEQDV
jgi:hypothetical protein